MAHGSLVTRPLHVGSRPQGRELVVVFALAVAGGAASVSAPKLAVVLALGILIFALLAWSVLAAELSATLLLVGGTMILAYGFDNLGIQTGFAPIPLAEALLLPLVAMALANPDTRPPSTVAVPVLIFVGIVAVRLLHDYPQYRTFSIRDSTTAIEGLTVFVGFRAVARDGVEPWIKRLRVIFMLVIAYGCLYPFATTIAHLGPTVGLQRSVPLLGSYEELPPQVAVATLFLALFSRGLRRVLFLAVGLALIGLFQLRGLYLFLPLAALVMGWALRRQVRVLLTGAAVVVSAVVLLSGAAALGLQGRVGPVSPSFYIEHFDTLLGGQGPSAATLTDREKWARETIGLVTKSPTSLLFGVGLGPDLTFGFLEAGSILVRKPHDDYLEVFARTGLVGFFVFLWLLIACLVPVARTARRSSDLESRLCAWVLAASVIYLGVAATQPFLAFPSGTVPLFFMLGMGLAARGGSDAEARSQGGNWVPLARSDGSGAIRLDS
jgi:O-antigen ligase